MAKTPSSGARRSSQTDADAPVAEKATAKSEARRETLQTLRRDVEDVMARLKQADDLTQQSVKSLQTAFSALEKKVAQDNQVNRSALNQKVDQLTQHLTGIIKQTHQAIAKDLAKAKANPSVENITSAIKSAEDRIAAAELAQAQALGKVNRHLASLAKAIDARFSKEAQSHKSEIESVTQSLKSSQESTERKLSAIERASAEAILKIGERVVSLTDEINARSDKGLEAVSSKIDTLSETTQSKFDTYRADLESYRSDFERRVEGLEETQRNLDSYTDRSIAKLTARIDNLEYGLSSMAPPLSQTEPDAPDDDALMLKVPVIEDAFAPDTNPEPAPTLSLHDKLDQEGNVSPSSATPHPAPSISLVQPAPAPAEMPNAYTQAVPQPPETPAQQVAPIMAFTPTEYTPGSVSPVTPSLQDASAYAPQPHIGADVLQNYGQTDMQGFGSDALQGGPDYFTQIDNPHDIAAEDLPYEDPAYAEHPADSGMERPGSFTPKTKSKKKKVKKPKAPKTKKNPSKVNFKLPGSRKSQVAAAALLAISVGYFAMRSGNDSASGTANGGLGIVVDDGTRMAPIADVPQEPAKGENQESLNSVDTTLPAIGEYQDNQGLTGDGLSPAANTLEKAALEGDSVAEFQLGLSYLQQGRTADAVKMIRASANKGQAAAQYRLAKLYEAGEGVTADESMARQLTERAARNGNRIAMHDLALYYADGRGDVDADIATAAKWFEKAALRGVVDSQYNLGVLNESGRGIPRNLQEAYFWYGIAARQGDQYARKHLEVLKAQIETEDVERAEARVAEFRPVSIDEAANGIFRNVSWAEPENLKVLSAKAQIRETQALLTQLGYDAGGADGSMGPKTRAAIVSFQKAQGLTETGQVDDTLIVQLQKAAGA